MMKQLISILLLTCGFVAAEDFSFQTPEWKSLKKIDVWAWPREMSDKIQVTTQDDCVVLDAQALEKDPDFRNAQMNVPGIDAEKVQGKNFLFTLDIDGPKNAAMNLFLEGRNSDGKFMAVLLQRGSGNSLLLRGGRQTVRFLQRLPEGIQELHWRFDMFKAGVYRIYSMKADFIPQPDAVKEVVEKPELLFYAPFDGSVKPAFAAGNAEPLVSENVGFSEGIVGQAANFSSKTKSRLTYELAKNMRRERGAISVWLKRDPQSQAQWRTILTMPWAGETRIGSGAIWFWIWDGKLRFDTSDILDRSLLSDFPEGDGWVHWVVTWNPLERRVYVNGKCVHGGPSANKRLDPLQPMIYRRLDFDRFDVGQYCGYNWLEGSLDELKIFSAPLSDDAITAIYRQERPFGMTVSKRYFYDDTPTAISGMVENVGDKATSVTVFLRNKDGKNLAEPLVLSVDKGKTPFAFPVQKFSAGDVWVALEHEGRKVEECLTRFFDSTFLKMPPTDKISLEPVETIDPLTLDDSRLAFVGTHSTGTLDGRSYLQAGPEYEERFAIRLPKMEPDALYCLDVDIPDDCQRTVDMIAQDTNQPQCSHYELHNGYLTGDEYPCTNRFLTQRLLYRARTADNTLVFMTARKGDGGAAVAQIRVSRVKEPLPQAVIHDAKPVNGWTRSVGVYFEDIALGYDFGSGLDTPEMFETTMNRLCEYMRFSGQNMLTYPIVWYDGWIGKEYVSRPHAPEYFDAMLTMFDRQGFSFMASINQYRVTMPTPLVTLENLKDGSLNNSPYMIHADGKPNKTHSICLFHPEIQAMMSRYIDDLLAEGVKHPSFKGISFHMVFNNLTTFGDLSMGYNDYLVEEFEKDTGITIPVDHQAPDRGKQYADWLLANAREKWIDWRCQKLAKFYSFLAQKLADARPDLRLVLNCKVAIGYQRNFGLPGEFTGQRDYWEQANREIGIDAKYFKDSPNIVLEQTVFPADYRWMAGRSDETVRETLRLTETRPGMYGTLRDAQRPWINMHDRYWESLVGDLARNPVSKNHFHSPWFTEHVWRVSTLNPTGFYALRHYILPLRYRDIQAFNKGGFLIGTLGMETQLREFAQSYRALPAVVFDDVEGSTETVRVRQHSDGTNTWFYIVNTSETPVRVVLNPGTSRVLDMGQNQEISLSDPNLTVELPPYHLQSFRAVGDFKVRVLEIRPFGG